MACQQFRWLTSPFSSSTSGGLGRISLGEEENDGEEGQQPEEQGCTSTITPDTTSPPTASSTVHILEEGCTSAIAANTTSSPPTSSLSYRPADQIPDSADTKALAEKLSRVVSPGLADTRKREGEIALISAPETGSCSKDGGSGPQKPTLETAPTDLGMSQERSSRREVSGGVCTRVAKLLS